MPYKRVSGLPWQLVGENVVIIDPHQNKIHELDPVGTAIWTELDGDTAAQDIADLLCQNYSCDQAMAMSDVDEFCETLADHGLIELKSNE